MSTFITSTTPVSKPPRLLEQVKRCIRDKHYSLRTEEAYVYWVRWYIRFHEVRLMECVQLRVKDMDFQRRENMVREGKGGKDRVIIRTVYSFG